MKILDVKPFHEGIDRNSAMLERLCDEMDAIMKTVEGLVAMEDSLKGEGGDAIRAFYAECHLPFQLFFDTTSREYIDKLRWMKNALDSLEPNPAGYIKQEFLEGDVEDGLQEIAEVTESLTDESNSIMDTVNDIVYLPHLDDSDVQEGVKRAGTRRDETITQLGAFDTDQTNALTSVETNFRAMETWIADLEGLFQDGLTDVDFPADMWDKYTETSPIKTDMAQTTEPIDDVEADGDGKTPNDLSASTPSVGDYIMRGKDIAEAAMEIGGGANTSFAMYMAGRYGGLRSQGGHPDLRNGGKSYRVYANEKGLKYLGVDVQNANNKDVMLKAASKKPGKSQWFSKEGKAAISNHPPLEYWSEHATVKEKAKTVGKATLKGAGEGFKDAVDFKGIKDAGVLKGAGKALGPVGAALDIHSNYQEAKADGLSGKDLAKRVATDTAVDTAVAGAVQAGSVALLTAIVPVTGVGTAIGVVVGKGLNSLLNKESKKTGKSAMDKIKGWFR